MLAVYRKEMKVYFSGMFGYAVMAILLLFMGLFVAVYNLLSASADFSYALFDMQWVLIVTIPFLTMRAIAQERHNRTDQLLFSLPLSLCEVVLGKYLALVTLFSIPTAISALYPLLLTAMGSVSLPAAYTALLGYFLMACALIAVCLFVSSLVENQIVAAVLCVLTTLIFYFLSAVAALIPVSALVSFLLCLLAALGVAALIGYASKNLTVALITAVILVLPTSGLYIANAALFTSLVPNFLKSISLFDRFAGFSYGHFDIPGVIFYLTFTAFFLFLTLQSMEKRRRA